MSDYNNDDIKDTEDEQKYEDVCYMCRRPESKTGRMLHIPGMNNMCICIDCMERSFRVMDGSNYADLMQGMNIQDIFPGGLNMDDMMNIQNQIPKKQKLKKKAKDGEEAHPEFDIKNIPAPHILKAKLDEFVIGQDQAKKAIAVAVYNHYKRVATNTMDDIEIEKSNILMIGPTGCGKTTLINLLLRFYDVDGGSIKVDGENINDITRHSLRHHFGMVLQDTWIKNGTVRENIAFGKPDATDEEIIAAAKAARAHSFIKRLKNGYDTVIGDDDGLSEGERQLLCIARVMLMKPPMLILDEATSSIDTRTELKVQDAFNTLMQGRTSFVVAHRLSTIRHADCILVMKDGKVAEQGTHEELLAKNGFYTKLYNSQFAQ